MDQRPDEPVSRGLRGYHISFALVSQDSKPLISDVSVQIPGPLEVERFYLFAFL